jgi:hypothetical protein
MPQNRGLTNQESGARLESNQSGLGAGRVSLIDSQKTPRDGTTESVTFLSHGVTFMFVKAYLCIPSYTNVNPINISCLCLLLSLPIVVFAYCCLCLLLSLPTVAVAYCCLCLLLPLLIVAVAYCCRCHGIPLHTVSANAAVQNVTANAAVRHPHEGNVRFAGTPRGKCSSDPTREKLIPTGEIKERSDEGNVRFAGTLGENCFQWPRRRKQGS